jgi:hypothetical protein
MLGTLKLAVSWPASFMVLARYRDMRILLAGMCVGSLLGMLLVGIQIAENRCIVPMVLEGLTGMATTHIVLISSP